MVVIVIDRSVVEQIEDLYYTFLYVDYCEVLVSNIKLFLVTWNIH